MIKIPKCPGYREIWHDDGAFVVVHCKLSDHLVRNFTQRGQHKAYGVKMSYLRYRSVFNKCDTCGHCMVKGHGCGDCDSDNIECAVDKKDHPTCSICGILLGKSHIAGYAIYPVGSPFNGRHAICFQCEGLWRALRAKFKREFTIQELKEGHIVVSRKEEEEHDGAIKPKRGRPRKILAVDILRPLTVFMQGVK